MFVDTLESVKNIQNVSSSSLWLIVTLLTKLLRYKCFNAYAQNFTLEYRIQKSHSFVPLHTWSHSRVKNSYGFVNTKALLNLSILKILQMYVYIGTSPVHQCIWSSSQPGYCYLWRLWKKNSNTITSLSLYGMPGSWFMWLMLFMWVTKILL